MRLNTSLLLLAGFAGPAIAHTGDGISLAALSHQIFGLHHLPFSILLAVVTIIAIGHWHSSKRSD